MTDRTHSLLSPSGGERWIACSPSARLTEGFPDDESDFAKEGTLAHDMCEIFIKERLGLFNQLQCVRQLERVQADRLYRKEMTHYAYEFTEYVITLYNEYKRKDPATIILVEQEVDLSAFIPEGRGHVDIAIITSTKIIVIDYKYGQGVLVKAQDNTQTKIYALGIFDTVSLDRDIEEIEIVIYQPRLENIDSDVIHISDFTAWVKNILVPAAQKAWKGEGEQKPGSHCKFCRLKSKCRAFSDYNMELADLAFQEVYTLTDEEIRAVMDKADMFKEWIAAVEKYVLSEAIKGHKWEGLKLVEGRSNRKFKSEEKVIKLLQDKGYLDSQIYNMSLRNLTDLEAHLGKKYFNTLLSPLIVKPQGKPTLVPVSDRRPEFKLRRSAEEDFADLDFDDELFNMIN